ncbi:MAG: carboxypeptidase regulatory-like domain-containing protein [Isosphaeraceae bacterium]
MSDLLRLAGLMSHPSSTAPGLAAQATAFLVAAFLGHALLGRRRAAARSALWNACLAGLLILPACGLLLPRLRLPVLPAAMVEKRPELPPPVLPIPRQDEPALPPIAHGPAVSPAQHSAPPSARSSISVMSTAWLLYAAVAAWLGLRLAGSLVAVARLRRCCRPVERGPWRIGLESWRSRLGIAQQVKLLASDKVTIPLVVGWWRPAIIVPEALMDDPDASVMDAVLVHELAHVRRGDYLWNLVRKGVEILYWPHPLAWLAGRVVAGVREQACDDLCVHFLGSAQAYRASLLTVAAHLLASRRPGPALGMAMARTSKLGRRLAWIDRSGGAPRCLARRPVRLLMAIAMAALAGLLGSMQLARVTAEARADEPPVANRPPKQPALVEVIVRAMDTGQPLANARVRAWYAMTQTLKTTGPDGRVRVLLSAGPRPVDSLSLDVWADGYVQQRLFFSQQDRRHPKIPGQVTLDLFPGEQTLGGKVVDEQGRPIAGVKVVIWGYLGAKKNKDELCFMVDAVTDAQGQWRCRSFRDMTFAYLYLSHPDYLDDTDAHPRRHGKPLPSERPDPDEKPMDPLRDFSDVQVLTRGVAIAGNVRDAQGQPVAGAEVGWLEDGKQDTFHDDMPTTMTDAAGRFRFPHARPGSLVLVTQAKGHSPEITPVEAKADAAPAVITLGPPHTIRGRVQDSQGRPIADAFVGVDTWRRFRCLGVFLTPDETGRFRWDDAPADAVLINASQVGYKGVHRQSVVPGEEAVFTLKRSLSISGRFRDAKTGKPIDKADVKVGTADPKTGEVAWAAKLGVFASQGYLQADVDVEQAPEFRLRFRAKGYEPFESRLFRGDERQVEYDVTLTPLDRPEVAPVVEGQVRRPDGIPLTGAEVAITYPMRDDEIERLPYVSIRNGKLIRQGSLAVAQTDAEGRFRLERESDPEGKSFAVVVVHPDFFAEANRSAIEANPVITARLWGRIEGEARVGPGPAAGAFIRSFTDRTGGRDEPYVAASGETRADDQGRFVLERVVPGELRVTLGSEFSSSYGSLLEIRPGETTRVTVGGKGRPVVARIAPPSGFDPDADYVSSSLFQIVSDRPVIPYPQDVLNQGESTKARWSRQWWGSPEGRAYRRAYFAIFGVRLQPDGTLRAEDIPPGEYRLNLWYTAASQRGVESSTQRVAHATVSFTIPLIPGGRSDEPFDLGVIRPEPKPGDGQSGAPGR